MAKTRHRAREFLIRFAMTGNTHRIFFFLYDWLGRAALPLLRRNQRLAAGFSQRSLRTPLPPADLWIQAASVGEAQLAWQLLGRLRPPCPGPRPGHHQHPAGLGSPSAGGRPPSRPSRDPPA